MGITSGIAVRFLAGVAAHHFLYYLLKTKVVPTVLFNADGSKVLKADEVVTAEIAKR